MTIVKWIVSPYNNTPERKEYDKETECFYIWRSGRMKKSRRDVKSSTYYRYFDSEADALEFIRQRAESKVDQKRVDRINSCGVELFEALNKMLDHFEGNIPVELFDLAENAITKAKGLA